MVAISVLASGLQRVRGWFRRSRWAIPRRGVAKTDTSTGAVRRVCLNAGAGGGVWISEGAKYAHSLEDTTMKAIRFAVVLFVMLLGCGNLLHAQTASSNSGPAPTVPDLAKLNVTTMLQQLQTTAAQGDSDAPAPLQIVVQFLQLQPAQQTVFGQLLVARQTAVAPLFQAIAQKEQQVQTLLGSGGNPAQVGILVIQITALQQQIVQTQLAFLTNLENMLDADQQQRLAAVRVAAQLQPVVPAFQLLQLM
jgi:hypothetical protein